MKEHRCRCPWRCCRGSVEPNLDEREKELKKKKVVIVEWFVRV